MPLGPDKDPVLFNELPDDVDGASKIERLDLEVADGIICTGLFVEFNETAAEYRGRYRSWPTGTLEEREGLEQLRFLGNAQPVRCVFVEALGRVFWELNNPEDVARIESILETS